MDGFAPSYKHVMPGCSQGNSVWMLRDFAAYRESQGGFPVIYTHPSLYDTHCII